MRPPARAALAIGAGRSAWRATGGKVIDPERPDTWPQPGAGERPRITRGRTIDLWENFTLVLALVALLGLDWLVRLRRGLV